VWAKKTYAAGKTTTMRVILGLDAPTSGRALTGKSPTFAGALVVVEWARERFDKAIA
jgi:ABC-type glutathione transport system ATPase component